MLATAFFCIKVLPSDKINGVTWGTLEQSGVLQLVLDPEEEDKSGTKGYLSHREDVRPRLPLIPELLLRALNHHFNLQLLPSNTPLVPLSTSAVEFEKLVAFALFLNCQAAKYLLQGSGLSWSLGGSRAIGDLGDKSLV